MPDALRSVCQSLNLLTTTFGSMVAGLINSIFAGWLPNNLDDGHAEYMRVVVRPTVARHPMAPYDTI